VAILTGSSGAQTAPATGSYQYDVYGNPIGASSTSLGFESSEVLPTGLSHFGARYYDPAIGAWTQQDPLAHVREIQESDLFAFAADDPLNVFDVLGLAGYKCRSGAENSRHECIVNHGGKESQCVVKGAEGAAGGAIGGAAVGTVTGPGVGAAAGIGAVGGAIGGCVVGTVEEIVKKL
jgi:RHS repeat-associated protein